MTTNADAARNATVNADRAAQAVAEPTPEVGQRWFCNTATGTRTVTVNRVWEAGDGHTAVAFEWRDDKPGQCGSALPLGVFHGTYKPVAAPAAAPAPLLDVDAVRAATFRTAASAMAAQDYEDGYNLLSGIATAIEAGQPEPAPAPLLSEGDREFLGYALDLTEARTYRGEAFNTGEAEALATLRKLAGGES